MTPEFVLNSPFSAPCGGPDEWEEMCIVPVSEAVSRVFQEAEFQELLSVLHMQAPTETVSYRLASG